MMSRGKLEYTGFARPADWAVSGLAALPMGQELLVVPDLHKDHRFVWPGTPHFLSLCLSLSPFFKA